MPLNLGRWVKYARARLDAAVAQGERSLDRREAEREAELADRPWLASEADAPTLDEARARIEWEAEHQRRAGDGATPAAGPPAGTVDDAAAASARLELDAREREAAERLARIREELGVDEPERPA